MQPHSSVRLLLASASPRRLEMIALLGFPFAVQSAGISERLHRHEPPAALALRLARLKATTVSTSLCRQPDNDDRLLVVACDTVVVLDGEVMGKPTDEAESFAMLRRLRGRVHAVLSAVVLIDLQGSRSAEDIACTTVWMRDYDEEEIAAYVASGDALDKAGAYAIQHPGFRPVRTWWGCYANVVGLPLCHLVRRLRIWGISPPVDVPTACQTWAGRACRVYDGILSFPCSI